MRGREREGWGREVGEERRTGEECFCSDSFPGGYRCLRRQVDLRTQLRGRTARLTFHHHLNSLNAALRCFADLGIIRVDMRRCLRRMSKRRMRKRRMHRGHAAAIRHRRKGFAKLMAIVCKSWERN